jgi:hypothetical protein
MDGAAGDAGVFLEAIDFDGGGVGFGHRLPPSNLDWQ